MNGFGMPERGQDEEKIVDPISTIAITDFEI